MVHRSLLWLLLLLTLLTVHSQHTTDQPQCVNCVDGRVTDTCPDPSACGYKPSCVDCMSEMPMPQCPNYAACQAVQHVCPMPSTFTVSSTTCLWFNSFYVQSTADWLLAAAVIATMCLVREYLVVYRTYRIRQRSTKQRKHSTQPNSPTATSTLLYGTSSAHEHRFSYAQQCADSLLYGTSLLISYMLMLLFMTYNVAVCATVVVACTVAHFALSVLVTPRYSTVKLNGGRVGVTQADHCCDDVNEYT